LRDGRNCINGRESRLWGAIAFGKAIAADINRSMRSRHASGCIGSTEAHAPVGRVRNSAGGDIVVCLLGKRTNLRVLLGFDRCRAGIGVTLELTLLADDLGWRQAELGRSILHNRRDSAKPVDVATGFRNHRFQHILIKPSHQTASRLYVSREAQEDAMGSRFGIVSYGLSGLWFFLVWQYVHTMLGPGQLPFILFLGLPPLVLVVIVRFLARGSL
jgi:hypothetical protein